MQNFSDSLHIYWNYDCKKFNVLFRLESNLFFVYMEERERNNVYQYQNLKKRINYSFFMLSIRIRWLNFTVSWIRIWSCKLDSLSLKIIFMWFMKNIAFVEFS